MSKLQATPLAWAQPSSRYDPCGVGR